MSTESDGYEESETGSTVSARQRIPLTRRGRTRISSNSDVAERVDSLTSSLRDTNRNLQEVGDLLGRYRTASNRQSSAIDRLRDDVSRSNNQLQRDRSERLTRHGSDTMSASELHGAGDSRRRRPAPETYLRSRRRPTVRFSRDVDEIHEIHQNVRDLSSDHLRLTDELSREVRRRNEMETENRRVLRDISDSVRKSQREESRPSERVEKRLKDLQEELRLQRESVGKRYKDLHDRDTLKTELRETLLNVSREEDRELRARLVQVEAERQKLASELESTRRRLDQSEGSTSTLHQQIHSLRGDLHRSDEDRHHLQSHLTRLQDSMERDDAPLTRRERQQRASRQDAEEEQQRDRGRLEREISSLRTQLSQASSLREFDDQRRELDRSHKQREQLSEHIDTLNKELDTKERNQAKILTQLKDATDSLAESEQQRQLALSQLEDLQHRLQQKSTENQSHLHQAKENDRLLTENKRKTEEKQRKLVEMVKQLKQKCKKLDRELEGRRMTSGQHEERNGELLKENETLKMQRTNMAHRMENLQREIADVLERLAKQDEQLRLKDIEANELKSSCLNLDHELRENRTLMDKLDGELRSEQARYRVLSDERLKLEQESDAAKASLHDAQTQNQKIQKELRDLTKQNGELSTKLSEMSAHKKETERQLAITEEEKQNIKQDLTRLDTQFKEVQDFNASLTGKLHKEMQAAKESEEKAIHDLIRRQKRERAEMEAEIQALKIEVAEERSAVKSLRRQVERGKTEAEKAREEIRQLDDENIKLKRSYDRIRAGFEEQSQLVEVGDNRASVLERHLQRTETALQNIHLDHHTALRGLVRDVDVLVGLVGENGNGENSPPPFSVTQDSPDALLADLKSKLHWLQVEVRRQADHRRRLKEDLNRSRNEIDEIARNHLADKYAYETHIARSDDVVRDLQYEKHDLQVQNLERVQTVRSLEKQVSDMEEHIKEGSKILQRSFERLPEPDHLPRTSEFDRLKELEKERQRIDDQYKRYQSTVTQLQQHLSDSKRLYGTPATKERSRPRSDNI